LIAPKPPIKPKYRRPRRLPDSSASAPASVAQGGEPPIPHVADRQQVIYLESLWCDGQEAMRNGIEAAR
jgi:hypothetical protein